MSHMDTVLIPPRVTDHSSPFDLDDDEQTLVYLLAKQMQKEG